MTELERNQEIANRITRDFAYEGQTFRLGDWVAILDEKVVAVAGSMDDALRRLRSLEPDPDRGMLVEVRPPTVEVIR